MTAPGVTEFLTKELLVNKEIVTFRSLSRELAIHVNQAKRELESFYQSFRQAVYATHLLIGEVGDGNNDMASRAFTPLQKKILLIGEGQLEEAKSEFLHPPSSHIYSLSPIPLRDIALLTTVADRIRSMDINKGLEHNQFLGMVVSSDVQINEIKSRIPELTKHAPFGNSEPSKVDGKKVDNNSKIESHNPPQKKTNKLDWSKAKAKTVKAEETAVKVKVEPLKDVKDFEKDPTNTQSKRGTKRPSDHAGISNLEGDQLSSRISKPRAPSPLPTVKNGKLGVILSDDDEKAPDLNDKRVSLTAKKKKRVLVSDEEEEEIYVGKERHDEIGPSQSQRPENDSHSQDTNEATGMLLDEPAIPPVPKAKRKPKVSVPVGRNGFPKKAVQKTRKTKNAKGYTVTEDYFSYESVSESETPMLPTEVQKQVSPNVTSSREPKMGISKLDPVKSQKKKGKNPNKDLNSYFTKK